MDYILLYFIYCQWELWIHSSFSLRKHWGVTGVPGTDTEGWGRWRKCTPWVHPLNRDKDNIRQALRGVSNSVEAICPCGDARGIRSSAQKRNELHRVDTRLAKTQYNERKAEGQEWCGWILLWEAGTEPPSIQVGAQIRAKSLMHGQEYEFFLVKTGCLSEKSAACSD